ncbi:MAG: protein translocase subunit SecD, partial [Campylobacterales bacterium]|nr:protein translocase subunit SecD [Campylobacterales bacterium]
MNKTVNFKFYFFIALIIFGLFSSYPSFFQTDSGKKITLGLDLQGGLYMLLGVKTEEAVNAKIKSLASNINYFSNEKNVLIDGLKVADGKVVFELMDKDEISKIDTFLSSIEGLNIDKNGL